MSGLGVEYILKNSLLRRTLDNVTVVMISFSNFKHHLFGESSKSQRKDINLNQSQNENINSDECREESKQNENNKRVIKENIPPGFITAGNK